MFHQIIISLCHHNHCFNNNNYLVTTVLNIHHYSNIHHNWYHLKIFGNDCHCNFFIQFCILIIYVLFSSKNICILWLNTYIILFYVTLYSFTKSHCMEKSWEEYKRHGNLLIGIRNMSLEIQTWCMNDSPIKVWCFNSDGILTHILF